jgi:UDP-N-acetylmuramoyl-L-alanyl-D-glutamate--2,6-diaminopimelate ligase
MAPTLTDSDIAAYLEQQGLLVKSRVRGTPVHASVFANSKNAQAGSVFIAYKGVSFDSHTVIADLVAKRIGFVVLEDERFVPQTGDIPYAIVRDSREALSYLAALVCGEPQNDLVLIGVTGTNGKSSTVWFVRELFSNLGIPILTIGTLGAYMGEERLDTEHTTPEPIELFSLLKRAKEKGIRHVCMEVSSHAISQKRVGPLRYSAVAFTSFSRDHLDYHANMDEYFAAKWELFSGKYLKPGALCLLNDTVAALDVVKRANTVKYLTYGFKPSNDVVVKMEPPSAEGSELTVLNKGKPTSGVVPLLAGYAAENFTAALLLTAHASGKGLVSPDKWRGVRDVPGRLERVRGRAGSPNVFVDYAHTPDSLEQSLKVLRPITRGKLWVVFGCGGDRDSGKRPLMGQVAVALADKVIITSDNPRTEDPQKIIQDIVKPLDPKSYVAVVLDRAEAIGKALSLAQTDDTVLIAGKGHEDYQIIGKEKKPFDDRKIAADFLHSQP